MLSKDTKETIKYILYIVLILGVGILIWIGSNLIRKII